MSGKLDIAVGIVKPDAGGTTIINQNNVGLEQRVTSLENAQGIKTGATAKVFVVWTGTGYEYDVTYPLYYINGQAFSAGTNRITLQGSHATLDRTDTFGLNASGAFAITGTPAETPIAPTVDSSSEIFVTTRDVKADTVEPAPDPNPTPVADVVVYKENTEWQTSSPAGGNDFNYTGKPFEGTKSIRITAVIKLKDTVSTHEASDFAALRFKVFQQTTQSYVGFNIRFLNNDTPVSSIEKIESGVDYPLPKTPAVYDTVLVDLDRFAFTNDTFNAIEITPIKGAKYTGNTYIDNISLIAQSVHVVSSSPSIDTSFFVRKDSFYFAPIDKTGVVTDLDISTKGGSAFTFIGTVTELHSLHNSNLIPKYFYGQDFYIKNDQAAAFLIKHNSGVIAQERYVFLFPNEQDLTIQPNEIFHFKAIMTEYNGGTLEFVGVIDNLGKLITDAEEKLTIHDDDKVGLADSEDDNKTKFWKWSTISAFFENLFEKKVNKGAANGYAPLDATTKLAAQYLNIVNDLVTGGATSLLSAEQGKQLQLQVNTIMGILFSDNVNMDTVQEIVDAIENVQGYLDTILVNDLTSGGTTKALTAEMGKTLKGLIDALYSNATIDTLLSGKSDKILSLKTITGTTYDVIANDSLTELVYDGTAAMTVTIPNNATVPMPLGTVFYSVATNTGVLTIAGAAGVTFQTAVGLSGAQNEVRKYTKRGTNVWGVEGNVTSSADMILASTQTVSGLKTFLNSMFGLRNSANTFTNLFSVITTAARTWTWPDKSGTVAMTSDIVAQLNGVVNYLVKFGTTTTGISSRLFDDGTFFGIGTVFSPTKDLTFGYQADREIGIEESQNTTKGKDLTIAAGRTINFVYNANFNPLAQTSRTWQCIAAASNGDIYAVEYGGNIYKQTGGGGSFTSLAQTVRNWYGVTVAPNGDVYACVAGGDIYKQTGGTGSFNPLSQTTRNWNGLAAAPNGDIYAIVQGSDIYKQTGGTGNFVALSQGGSTWRGIAAKSNGDIYACIANGDIYKQTGGTGSFVALGQANRVWWGVTVASNGDVFAIVNNGDIYKQTGGTGTFNTLSQGSRNWWGIAAAPNGNIYATNSGGDIYMQNNDATGTANLDGGTLINRAGTGKGTGKSRWQLWTGQKTTSGTGMQILTKRIEIDEDGNYKRIGTPVYADNTAALAGGLTAGMEYRTSMGIKMEVY